MMYPGTHLAHLCVRRYVEAFREHGQLVGEERAAIEAATLKELSSHPTIEYIRHLEEENRRVSDSLLDERRKTTDMRVALHAAQRAAAAAAAGECAAGSFVPGGAGVVAGGGGGGGGSGGRVSTSTTASASRPSSSRLVHSSLSRLGLTWARGEPEVIHQSRSDGFKKQ
jgi:hypothetical protein